MDGESTSARLARIAAERDEFEARLAGLWLVARADGATCPDCAGLIRRGEGFEPVPGADAVRHVHCPDRPGGFDQWASTALAAVTAGRHAEVTALLEAASDGDLDRLALKADHLAVQARRMLVARQRLGAS